MFGTPLDLLKVGVQRNEGPVRGMKERSRLRELRKVVVYKQCVAFDPKLPDHIDIHGNNFFPQLTL